MYFGFILKGYDSINCWPEWKDGTWPYCVLSFYCLDLAASMDMCREVSVSFIYFNWIVSEISHGHKFIALLIQCVLDKGIYFVWFLNSFFFSNKILEDISPFCGSTDVHVLDFWWQLPWVSKPELIPPSLASFASCMWWIPQIHLWCSTCWPPGAAEPLDPHTFTSIGGTGIRTHNRVCC